MRKNIRGFVLLATLLLALLPGTLRAQVLVNSVVTFDGTFYNYAYTVTNNSTDILALVTIHTLTGTSALDASTLTAPTGFQTAFDSGLGTVSFLEDADPLTPGAFDPGTVVSGFGFKSQFGPGPSSFDGLYASTGNAFSGVTTSPVPEASTLVLSAMLLCGLPFALRRRARTA